MEAATPVSAYEVPFALTLPICLNALLLVERSILNAVSLFELSVQDRLIRLDDAAVAVRFVGAAGVGVAVGAGVGVGVLLIIWTIFATEGTPFEFKMNSM